MRQNDYLKIEGYDDIFKVVLRNPGDAFLAITNVTVSECPDIDPRRHARIEWTVINVGSYVSYYGDNIGSVRGKVTALDIPNALVEIRFDHPVEDGRDKGTQLVVIRAKLRDVS